MRYIYIHFNKYFSRIKTIMQSDFDSTFNYTKAIAGLNKSNQNDKANLEVIQAELDDYNTAGSAWSALTKNRVDQLTFEQKRINAIILQRTEVINEMNAIAALSQANKAALYTMYAACGDSVTGFMLRMPFNIQTALADPDVNNLLSDTTLTSQVKSRLAKLTYVKYNVNSEHSQALAESQRYLLSPTK